jgi:hypothetical protein
LDTEESKDFIRVVLQMQEVMLAKYSNRPVKEVSAEQVMQVFKDADTN